MTRQEANQIERLMASIIVSGARESDEEMAKSSKPTAPSMRSFIDFVSTTHKRLYTSDSSALCTSTVGSERKKEPYYDGLGDYSSTFRQRLLFGVSRRLWHEPLPRV
ncbi:hypothetical protein G6O67_008503 [Ophiocordyceps sinensis]|uniref:Uncharacterized protein n=1 Tax=Ophiocordyceps sinensis TaxID=72228 RepID=A0A8H4LSM3_9HYPO|nr:hypothetical protein G6O67_008503 [Ophiocordyceps sinensis]